ncbi:MAG: HlyD family type I secretion periplasmic adaptor subunit [Paracoccus denitrificans]|nr:MAG: HlyD family type I secretion periplasmic adaptor subunit [Paracoccus denitrificans]PZO85343.1 MAG: HlyD family type I secretion periplasmic adaptor subunit [Paracoccus denitrificans]
MVTARVPEAYAPRRVWPVLSIGFVAIVLILGGFGAWATTTQIAGAVVAPGQVEVDQQRKIVQHLEGGVVARVLVRDGQTVNAGDVLIELDGAPMSRELAAQTARHRALIARQARLLAERAGAETLTFPSDRTDQAALEGETALWQARRQSRVEALAQLSQQRMQAEKQLDAIAAQMNGIDAQFALISQELSAQRSLLAKGLTQSARVIALERDAAALTARRAELDAARAQSIARVAEIDIQHQRLDAQRREEVERDLRDLDAPLSEVELRMADLTARLSALEIRAPTSGVVYQLQVTTPKAVIRPAEPLMQIVPQDSAPIIAARIPLSGIDDIHAGQQVILRFSGLPNRTMPEIDGLLDRISADAVTDPTTRAQYYRAEITLPETERAKIGATPIIPGMPVEVYVPTEARTPLTYLIKPLADYFRRAFRET